MESLRRIYGIAEPVRRGMELKIVRDGQQRPAVLGGSKGGNIHEDILVLGGRDTEVTWEDVFHGMRPALSFSSFFGLLSCLGGLFYPLPISTSVCIFRN
jgi:proteasome maturation protein